MLRSSPSRVTARFPLRVPKMKSVPEENVGGGQGRVTAQVDLHRRREPAQGHDVAARDDKSGLGKIVFGGDSREDAVGQQIVQQDHRRRISTEHPVGEGVDLVEGQLHEFLTLPANVRSHRRATAMCDQRATLHARTGGLRC